MTPYRIETDKASIIVPGEKITKIEYIPKDTRNVGQTFDPKCSELCPSELQILEALFQKKGEVVPFEELISLVSTGNIDALRMRIKRLRSEMPDITIVSVRGRGYKLR